MQCDICSKNPATVHLTEIIEGAMTELHLCEDCARQKSAQMEQQFGLSDLLAGMAEFGKLPKEAEPAALACPKCALTYSDFKKIGRLGCGGCYEAFRRYLAPLLKRIHGSSEHHGKAPYAAASAASAGGTPPGAPPGAPQPQKPGRRKTAEPDVVELRVLLQKAIEKENFEEAARLRDRIRDIEKKSAGPGQKEKNDKTE
jgi:protein arginine kinase activator